MRSRQDMFSIWAPDDSPWSPWAKPVLFAKMPPTLVAAAPEGALPQEPPIPPLPNWFPASSAKVAIVIDCLGPRSVWLGIAAAQGGYRPVPLFNSLPGSGGHITDTTAVPETQPRIWPIELVETYPTQQALAAASDILVQLNLPHDAPPAFLLDSGRRRGIGPLVPNRFDNRSVVFPTDFPSANFLLSQQINRILLIQEVEVYPDDDLAHTMLRWQQAGLRIDTVALEGGEPMQRGIGKPDLFGWIWYRLKLMAGLRPALGGFGGLIPEPSSGG